MQSHSSLYLSSLSCCWQRKEVKSSLSLVNIDFYVKKNFGHRFIFLVKVGLTVNHGPNTTFSVILQWQADAFVTRESIFPISKQSSLHRKVISVWDFTWFWVFFRIDTWVWQTLRNIEERVCCYIFCNIQ